MLEYDFMQNAFAAATIVAIVVGAGRLFPGAARANLRRSCARACRLHRSDRGGPDRHAAALGSGATDRRRRSWHGRHGRAAGRSATSRSASFWRSRSVLACCSCTSSRPTRLRRRPCCSAMCSLSTSATVWTLLGLGVVSVGALAIDLAAPTVREPAAGIGRSEGRVAPALFGVVPGHCRARGRRMRADRRRPACLRADGRSGGGGAALGERRWHRPRIGRRSRPLGSLGGIALAFYSDWPASFWITALSAGIYLLAALSHPGRVL